MLAYHSRVSAGTKPLEYQPSQQVIARNELGNCSLDRLAYLFYRAAMSGMASTSLGGLSRLAIDRPSRTGRYAGIEYDASLMPVRHQ